MPAPTAAKTKAIAVVDLIFISLPFLISNIQTMANSDPAGASADEHPAPTKARQDFGQGSKATNGCTHRHVKTRLPFGTNGRLSIHAIYSYQYGQVLF
jgi:hypothetical protein